MSDLVKRLREACGERQAFEQWLSNTAPSGDADSVQRQWENCYQRERWMEDKVDGEYALLAEAADRIQSLEDLLRQAREALQSAAKNAKAEGHAFRPWRHAAADSVAAINDLLKD